MGKDFDAESFQLLGHGRHHVLRLLLATQTPATLDRKPCIPAEGDRELGWHLFRGSSIGRTTSRRGPPFQQWPHREFAGI